MKKWIENCYWSWRNVIYARLVYNDKIDYCLFWEELSAGYIEMKDEWIMSKPNFDPYNLSGRDPYYTYTMRNK
jgi:hypothetical protein